MLITILGWQGPGPGADGACSGCLAEDENGSAVAIDMGAGSLSRLMKAIDPRKLKAIILSHLHWDHISDMLPLGYLAGMTDIPVFAPARPAQAFDALTSLGWKIHPHEDMRVGDMQISFGPARHPVPCSSVRIECHGRVFVYTGDTNTHPGLAAFARGADLLLADAGLREADWAENKPHLSPALCGKLASEAGVRKMVITHLSPFNDKDLLLSEASAVFPETTLAEGGLQLKV